MLLGQDNIIQIVDKNRYLMRIRDIHSPKQHFINETNVIDIINHKHCKTHHVMIRIETECGKIVVINRHIYLQVLDDNIPRTIFAQDIRPGMIIYPPIPSNSDADLWIIQHGVVVKYRHLVLSNASHIIFDECDYVIVNGVPLLHNNAKNRRVRRISRISKRLARIGLR